jgi:hypothetical protein
MRFRCSWSDIAVACPYFVFCLSNYGKDFSPLSYWKGVYFYFRFPWEPLKEGERFPHGFEFVTDRLFEDEQCMSLGRTYDA